MKSWKVSSVGFSSPLFSEKNKEIDKVFFLLQLFLLLLHVVLHIPFREHPFRPCQSQGYKGNFHFLDLIVQFSVVVQKENLIKNNESFVSVAHFDLLFYSLSPLPHSTQILSNEVCRIIKAMVKLKTFSSSKDSERSSKTMKIKRRNYPILT
jgi:hypothetical protein